MNMRTGTLAGALGALLMTATTASAGDYAELNILGFAPDGETWKFRPFTVLPTGHAWQGARISHIDLKRLADAARPRLHPQPRHLLRRHDR